MVISSHKMVGGDAAVLKLKSGVTSTDTCGNLLLLPPSRALTCSSVSWYSSWKLKALAEEGTTALANLSPCTTILLGQHSRDRLLLLSQ